MTGVRESDNTDKILGVHHHDSQCPVFVEYVKFDKTVDTSWQWTWRRPRRRV